MIAVLYTLLALAAPEAAPPATPAAQTRPVEKPVETIVVTASSLGDPSDAISQGVAVINRGEALQASISGGFDFGRYPRRSVHFLWRKRLAPNRAWAG